MIAELKFNLPEDEDDFRTAIDGGKYFSVLFDFDQYLRSEIKYNGRNELQDIREALNDLMRDRGVSIYD